MVSHLSLPSLYVIAYVLSVLYALSCIYPSVGSYIFLYAQIHILQLTSYRLRYNKILRKNKTQNTKITFYKKKLKKEGKIDFRHAK
jgi:hypothetical protein